MQRRTFMRYAGLAGAGAIAIPIGLSGCALLSDQKAAAHAASGDAPLAYGTPASRPHANAEGPPRMILVFLRGAVDGLNVVVPYGDHAYYQARPTIAVARPGMPNGVIDLTGYFGLHPALLPLLPYWKSGQLAFVHACGSPDSSRSHFEAQDYMETGTPGQHNTRDGWMNRLQAFLPQENSPVQALAVGSSIPRILSGTQVVANLASGRDAARPTLIDQPRVSQAFSALYDGNDALSKAYRDGLAARKELLGELGNDEQRIANNGAPLPNGLAIDSSRLGRLMRSDARIRLGFLAVGGWDTHASQGNGSGQLATRLNPLAVGLATLAQELGPAFNDSVIVVVSEFGRTFHENGNGGTDHGHGNVIWLLGGNVRGHTIYGEWPGLNSAALHEGRDLAITTDFRAVMATLAEKHLRLQEQALQTVFPHYTAGRQHVGNILL